MSAAEIAHGLIDAEGRLIEAEDPLLGLAMRTGGGLGRPLAAPQLATLARLARRLQVPIARDVVIADREADIELFVRARLDGPNVRLSVAGWRERPPWRPANDRAEADLLDAAADWGWETDAALRLRYVPIDAGARHGFDAAGLQGRSLTELFAFEPDAEGQLPILTALADRRSFSAQPARLRPSGRPALVYAIAQRDAGNVLIGFRGGVSLVEEPRTDTVARTIGDRLERALRTPLRQIVANADTIHAGTEEPVGSDYAAYAADIASAARHLIALVDDLADLEAVERPDFRPEMEALDLADLARRAAGLLSVRASNAGVTIARPKPDASVPATGDFRRVLQIVVNLIGNAVRYSPPGAAVAVAAEQDGRVTVSDTGKGIALEDQQRIFEKFERVDATESGGSGLGLYIARRLARAMGGDVTVESAPGEGACFTLALRMEE